LIESSFNGDFWDLANKFDAILVTTNGILKKDHTLVMGAGIARQFAEKFPTVPKTLGDWVRENGNKPCCIHGSARSIISMPTKNHFKDNSDLDLITKSAILVKEIADRWGFKTILSTAPGCGMGNLAWAEVKPVIAGIWDDRFTVLTPRR